MGRAVNGVWPLHLIHKHINYLELLTVWLALKHFLSFIRGHHVLVKTKSSTVVAYINRQGGTRSLKLHQLAKRLIVWSDTRLLSLRVTHVPGILNRGADLLSRGNPLYGEWKLHPQVVNQIWQRYDLFASQENAHCPLFFSLADKSAPLSVDALAHPWPDVLLYAFPPLSLISPHSSESKRTGSIINTDSSMLAIQTLGGRNSPTAFGPAVGPSFHGGIYCLRQGEKFTTLTQTG